MTRVPGALYAFALLAVVSFRPVRDFITQAVLGGSPLNPKDRHD